jgi:signal transduction histidine kinase/CHASE3 domain sensor protein
MRFGLTFRLALAGALVLVFLVAEFALSVSAFRQTARSTDAEQRERDAAYLAQTTQKLVLDLETGSRGYVITHDPRFLEPWISARRLLPKTSLDLMNDDPGPEAGAISQAAAHYLQTWALPLVALARRDPAAARARVSQGIGKRQVDHIRRLVEGYVTRRLQAADRSRDVVSRDEHMGELTAGAGIVVTAVLFLAIIGYFLRTAVAPVRRIAEATKLVSRGEFDVVVPEGGAGEVGLLASAFNEMARSLARQQGSLAEQNVDLERLANVLRAVLDSTVDGILLSDPDGNLRLANRPLVQMTRELGMSYEGTVVDRLLSVAGRMKDPGAYRAAMERLRFNPGESTFDEFEEAETGRVFQGWTSVVRDQSGVFLGRIWTLREVTQQRELERLKDEFVATVSHELRTPLTSMMGFLQMIREGEAGDLTADQERFLAIVYRSSERLQRLVGDLLFVARLDASGLQLQFDDVRVDEVMHEAVEAASPTARSRELELVQEIAEVPPIFGDRERLSQLLGNLLSNALKFTPASGTVTARTFAEDGHVVAEVEDTGIGIPAAEQSRLFQRFFRSSTATAQAIPGTGLGLVISKAIVEAHGGRITVKSTAGKGTCFRIELPIERVVGEESGT